jgi:hypothetical protein
MSIVAYRFELYEMENLKIGQFIALSFFSTISVLFVAFLVCRKSLLRRLRRYQPRPAQVAHNITHFDSMMPPTYHPA